MPHSVTDEIELPLGQRYWNKNLREDRWTEECPDFLLGISEKNKGILSSEEADYKNLSWLESQELVGKTNLRFPGFSTKNTSSDIRA